MGHGRTYLTGAAALAWFGSSLALGAQAAHSSLPKQQDAMVQSTAGGPDTLTLQSVPVLVPGDGQVLIRVYAASVNPADWGLMQRPAAAGESIQRIPGLDVAGVIAAVGSNVTDRSVGTAVFGMVERADELVNGGYSHFALASASSTAPKPANMSFDEAAGLGVVGATALRALDAAQVQAGQRVLITGVAGGVGSTAAQIALARGVTVFGTASPRHDAYLHRIGVTHIIDYTRGDIPGQSGPVDAVLDTTGGSEAMEAFHALKSGGHFVTVGHAQIPPEECSNAHVDCSGSPGSAAHAPVEVLLQIAELARRDKLTVHIDRIFPFARTADALEYNHAGHTEGKVIVEIDPAAAQR